MLKKHKILLLIIINLFILILFTALFKPGTDMMILVFIVLILIYSLSSLAAYQVISLVNTNNASNKVFALAVGVIPPATILLLSVRQASPLDFLIIMITVVAIIWYFLYKK